jgi:ATP-dependent RNA helicase DDX54/DBP10
VAARGIDIPVLANVINYDFPSQPKIFVHRVGRTARAGQAGWSYSLVRDADAPYLLDLQLFLGRRLVVGRQFGTEVNYAEDVVTGTLSRDPLSQSCEWVNKVLAESTDIASQRQVSVRGEKLYMRTRNAASIESAKRAKKVTATEDWSTLHPLFNDDESQMEAEREKMLARIGGFRPSETVFEVQNRRGGKQEGGETIDTIKRLRATVDKKKLRAQSKEQSELAELGITVKQANGGNDDVEDDDIPDEAGDNMSEADESDLEVTFSSYNQKGKTDQSNEISATSFQNPDYFMGYTPANHNSAEDRAYGVHSGTNSNFAHESRNATMDLNGDEGQKNFGENRSVMRWDKRHKKYVARQNDEDGSKGTRLVRGESGAKIAASFRSGRFQSWKKGKRMSNLPRVGEAETPGLSTGSGIPGAHGPGGRFRHQRQQAPKRADPLRYDFEKQKKKNDTARDRQQSQVGGAASHGKSEIRSTDDIRKARKLQQRRREKNARPSRKR